MKPWILILFLWSLLPVQAPFLYYYSDYWNGFIIERADGTQSHLIGQDLMPTEASLVWSEWSASGEWLAWTAWSDTDINRTPYAAHVDGQHHLTTLDEYLDAVLAWSPMGDQLLVAGIVAFENQTARIRLQMIDAAHDRVLNAHEFSLAMEQLTWTPFSVQWIGPTAMAIQYTPRAARHVVYTMTADSLTQRETEWDSGYTLSPAGTIYYDHRGQIGRYDPFTGEQVEIAQLTCKFSCIAPAEWQGALALIPMTINDHSQLYLLDATQNTLEKIATIRIDVPFFEPVPPGNRFWSPDGQTAVFVTVDGTLTRFDPVTRTTTPLMENQWGKLWVSPQRMNVYNEAGQVYLYDLDDGVIADGQGEDSFYLSPDGKILLNIFDEVRLHDLATDAEQMIPPHPALHRGESSGEVLWQGDWFLLQHYDAPGFIGKGTMPLTVGNTAGTVIRNLEPCEQFWFDADGETGCGWLPARVPLDKLGAPFEFSPPEPLETVLGTDYAAHLQWSPDGEQIAVGAGGEGYPEDLGWNFVWNIKTPALNQTLTPVEFAPLEWALQADGTYTAQLGQAVEPEAVYWLDLIRATSPDGTTFLRYEVEDPPTDGSEQCTRLYLVEATTQQRTALEDARKCDLDGRPIFQVAYSPDGRWIAGGSFGTYLHLWDAHTGALVQVTPIWALSVAFSPDGEKLAVGTSWWVEVYRVADLLP